MDTLQMIKHYISEMKKNHDDKNLKKLGLPLTERVAGRLSEFSDTCKTCAQMLKELEIDLKNNLPEKQFLERDLIISHKKKLKLLVSHLTKEHHLVRSGYYAETYMALGLSLGVVFGLAILDNLAIGIAVGLVLGVGIGSGKDADAKKKGLVI